MPFVMECDFIVWFPIVRVETEPSALAIFATAKRCAFSAHFKNVGRRREIGYDVKSGNGSVVAGTAKDCRRIPGCDDKCVDAGASNENIRASAAVKCVVASIANEDIVALTAIESVGVATAYKNLICRRRRGRTDRDSQRAPRGVPVAIDYVIAKLVCCGCHRGRRRINVLADVGASHIQGQRARNGVHRQHICARVEADLVANP